MANGSTPEHGELWPIPTNLIVVGTVNVDETTYMFSPKVLDRAFTFEFRVRAEDLDGALRRPAPAGAARPASWLGLWRRFATTNCSSISPP